MTLEALLRGGDPRQLKGVSRAVNDVQHDLSLLPQLVTLLEHADPLVRMRAADALEKISRVQPVALEPHRYELLRLAATTAQASLRWHLAQIIPRLQITTAERRAMFGVFKSYLDDKSAVVKATAMQAMSDFALADPALRRIVIPLLRALVARGGPAVRVRGSRLLEVLGARATPRTR
jgi:HEAT repeat protein